MTNGAARERVEARAEAAERQGAAARARTGPTAGAAAPVEGEANTEPATVIGTSCPLPRLNVAWQGSTPPPKTLTRRSAFPCLLTARLQKGEARRRQRHGAEKRR